jgi:hypothetical protein
MALIFNQLRRFQAAAGAGPTGWVGRPPVNPAVPQGGTAMLHVTGCLQMCFEKYER